MKDSMHLVFLGPPGAGKGTLADLFEERKGWQHISTGDLLREEVKKGTPLGKSAKKYMDKGLLVPDKLVVDVLRKNLDTSRGFILDGFPRNRHQAESLDESGIDIDLAIEFKVSLTTIIERLAGRRICRKCGKIYHLKNHPPKKEGRCDECGGVLYQREDDKEEVIRKRMEIYEKEAEEVSGYYREKGRLREISAEGKREEIFSRIEEAIREYGAGKKT